MTCYPRDDRVRRLFIFGRRWRNESFCSRPPVTRAAGLVVAALINGGVFTIVPTSRSDGFLAYRMNRLTGEVCYVDPCGVFGPIRELPPQSPAPEPTPEDLTPYAPKR